MAQTLRNLVERRDAGDIRAFRRIVIETSGLADPGPILFTLGTDPLLDHRLRLARVVTVIDTVTGAANLDRFAEAARQAAVADALYISKTDLAPFDAALAQWLDALNPRAERIVGTAGSDPAEVLFAQSPKPVMAGLVPAIHVDGRDKPGHDEADHAAHTHGLAAYTVVLGGPLGRLDFARALGELARERGYDLLRVKGIVAFADEPDRPALIQAAQHALLAPEWLDDWPDADRRSRLVFVVHDIPVEDILDRFAFAAPSLIGPPASGRHAGGTPALHRGK